MPGPLCGRDMQARLESPKEGCSRGASKKANGQLGSCPPVDHPLRPLSTDNNEVRPAPMQAERQTTCHTHAQRLRSPESAATFSQEGWTTSCRVREPREREAHICTSPGCRASRQAKRHPPIRPTPHPPAPPKSRGPALAFREIRTYRAPKRTRPANARRPRSRPLRPQRAATLWRRQPPGPRRRARGGHHDVRS